MNIILGFGDTEKRFEEKLENIIRDYVAEQYSAGDYCYFTDSFRDEMVTWINSLSYGSRTLGDEYKHAENYPDRYTYYFASMVSDASHIVFIIKFHHINRRHAMSPDGWALMTSERVFYIDTQEAERKKKAA
jgi:hypothetical protein